MIICIVGPTGVGKTKMSIELAKKYDAIVVNADATQIYKGLDIGSAKITAEEKENIEHLLFDIRDVNEDYTVFDYQQDARKIIEKYKNRNIIFVGGTGLYLKAALYDYRFNLEEKTNISYDNYSNEELYNMALEKDPTCTIHPNNRVRLIRFLNKIPTEKVEPIKLYDHLIIGLTTDREILYERIDKRVDIMLQNGLLEEVKSFYDNQIRTKPLKCAIGYKELYEYFDGNVSLEEAIAKIKQNSRHYAKRQYTFFNHQLDVNWFNVDFINFQNTINEVIKFIEKEQQKWLK